VCGATVNPKTPAGDGRVTSWVLPSQLSYCSTLMCCGVLCCVGEYPTFGDYLRTLDGFITATGDRAQPGTAAYRVVSQG
jgi:hypothetical protein